MNEQELVNTGTNSIDSTGTHGDKIVGTSKLLKVISNVDALLIFSMAKDGIEAETRTHSKIGLTRKQYYTRLMQLKNTGLIERKGKLYFQTTMGSFLQENCINSVIHAIRNAKKMSMIDVLSSNSNFSEEDLLQMKSAICTIPIEGTD